MINQSQWETAKTAFSKWAEQALFKQEHKTGTAILDEAVDIHLCDLYTELKLHTLLQTSQTAHSLSESLNFSDSAHIALDAMLYRLAKRSNFVTMSEANSAHTFTAVSEPVVDLARLAELKNQMAGMGEDYVAPMEFLEFGRTHFMRSMRDDHEFMDRVLTGQESEFAETWHRATNTDPLQDVHGIMGAKAIELLHTGGTILEVGGGTGNGIRNNLQALQDANRLDELENYIFTDVSMQFIVTTRNELRGQFEGANCQWRLLNINKDFKEQRIEDNSADIIYGVNAAHIAKHTVDFMQQCRATLKPGGLMVYAERLRRDAHEMAPREIVLNQSSYHRTAAIRHSEYRPAHAYLAREHWIRACELAGFEHIDVWPGIDELADYFPDQYAAVVVAQAPK